MLYDKLRKIINENGTYCNLNSLNTKRSTFLELIILVLIYTFIVELCIIFYKVPKKYNAIYLIN